MSGFGAKTEPSEILENINLADKTVIITGGYSGIGLETTKAIKANGARVLIPAKRLDVATKELSGIIPREDIFEMDLADLSSVKSFTDSFNSANNTLDILINNAGIMAESFSEPKFALAFALIENHYFVNKGFLEEENQLIEKGIDIIRSIPTVIVQGRYDMVCPMTTAWELSQNWPEAELIIAPSSGHTAFEKEITHELINATNKFGSNND